MIEGAKVIVVGREDAGYGELLASDSPDTACVRYYFSPVGYEDKIVPTSLLRHTILPEETRCYCQIDKKTIYGRVLAPLDGKMELRNYFIRWGGMPKPVPVNESDFQVRSYLPAHNPAEVLASLSNETPYFFENRFRLLRQILRQSELAHGLNGLLSSKIDLLPHQIQIASLVLRDPTIRFLLADEVGLGKTIEAGIILRQLSIDTPGIKMAAFVPDQLVQQWLNELDNRFELKSVEVFGHSDLSKQALVNTGWDIVVIDEAHRVVSSPENKRNSLASATARISRATNHLLLLSATPVLHHDTDLLALLELLDPENYSLSDLDGFRTRTGQRSSLGRAFLALSNATVIPLIKLNAKKLAELLPLDSEVQKFSTDLGDPSADVKAIHRGLHLHISETYRIHRRLLRTRRRWLIESDSNFVRDVEEHAWSEPIDEPYMRHWETLDEWRTEVAGRVAREDYNTCSEEYIRLAEAIAAEPGRLETLVEDVIARTKSTTTEQRILRELVNIESARGITSGRAALVCQIIRQRIKRDRDNAKYVVFCPSPESCDAIVQALELYIQHSAIRVANRNTNRKEAGSIISKFADDSSRILVTDTTGEEGFNLQFSCAIIFYDLPWSPMRIEQRLGRLDRIERAGRIICYDITSGEDETLCLDEVWRRVLSEGFNIFKHSISDLQHLIDGELPRLREIAFVGGPEALTGEIENLKLRVAKEREAIEEQDVIDGMHSLSLNSPLCNDLAQADEEATKFGDSLVGYLQKNVGLREHWNEENNSISFKLKKNESPIIPVDQINPLAAMLNKPSTFYRNVAVEDADLQFLRPGHRSVSACRDLLSWDDRGRAFAMWRYVEGQSHLKTIFRCLVNAHADISPLTTNLKSAGWDSLHCGGLHRMIVGWFPEFITELFLDEEGNPANGPLSELCKHPYRPNTDVNLGKERAEYVRKEVGSATWHNWCTSAAEAALRNVSASDDLNRRRETALNEALQHFALTRTRLSARNRAGIDTEKQTNRALEYQKELEDIVVKAINKPAIRLDTIGAYLFSSKKFWEGDS